MKEVKDKKVAAMLVQKHQLNQAESKISEIDRVLLELGSSQSVNSSELDRMLLDMEALLAENNNVPDFNEYTKNYEAISNQLTENFVEERKVISKLSIIESIEANNNTTWDEYSELVEEYAFKNQIDLINDPFSRLMSRSQKIDLEKRIQNEFTYKTASCDKYDYMIAGTCGIIGGLIDIFFVGVPGNSKLGSISDAGINKSVEKFAELSGWNKEKAQERESNLTASAIGFLEKKYKVNYDHRHGGDVNHLFKMSTKNHHIKSLGHSPDLVGLFFSVLGQFTNTAYFIDGGKLISIDTDNFELQGGNFIAKIYCGFVNWIGHLFSDMAGSSGAVGRGSGIPIPFYSLLQFVNVGEFGQHRQSFAQISVQVFEQGYDFRHGLAMAIPVLVTELLTRITWVIKQKTFHNKTWKECIPTANNPELRRMLLIAHGVLCLSDAGDAAVRSSGDMIQFLLRTNIIGWTRFGTLALKELNSWYKSGHIDPDSVDKYLDEELSRMLVSMT